MADQTFAVNCGFFDAINSDRVYSADEMNRPYKRVISNGVFATPNGTPSTDLQVVASSGMSIICKKGEGLFGDKWFENPSGIAITVPSNTGTVPRIDSVLVQVDTRTSGRVGNIVHRTGTPASTPVPPAINQVEGVIEYRLASIRVNAGVSAITQSMITDRRGSSDCPWVTSLIYQVDTSTLYDQWAAAYAEYFKEEKAIWDAWYAQLTEDLDVSMTLDRHTNTVTTTAQTTGTIPIGLAYNHNTDILEVYINGLRAIEGTHYIVVNDDTAIMVENQLDIGQTVTFVVMRSVISGSATNITVLLQELESQIAGIAGGTPTVVDAKADMTEHNKIYILSTDSKWYYYSATQEDWMIGGTYGGVPTDPTLTQEGMAADAKAVGDALALKADNTDVAALDTRVTAVETAVEGKADSADVDTISDDLSSISNIVTYTPYGENLIPTSPTYVSWIDPAKYDFSAVYDLNKITFGLKVLQSVSGAKSIRFGTASTGYTPIDLTGKLVRITASPTSAFDGNIIFVVIGISDDGTQTQSWNITFPTTDGEYVYTFDCDTFESRTGYKNLFLSGFYLNSSFSASAGQEYKIVVEIAGESEVEDGWNITDRLDTKTDKIINMLPKVVYGFSRFNTHGVNHRGFRTVAPENTLPAFRLSKQKGFDFVETDVQKTSDGVYVLLHDETINRTARNEDGTQLSSTINISDITYAQALEYDFGIFKGAEYAGTRIPTLEQFIVLCSKLELYPYIELKQASAFTETDIVNMLNIVRKYHMEKNVTWISFSWNLQHLVFLNDSDARVGWLGTNMNSNVPSTALSSLSNGRNECFIDANYNGLTSEFITLCKNLGIKIEVYNAESESIMTSMDEYISGATSDSLNYQKVIYDANIGETDTGIIS